MKKQEVLKAAGVSLGDAPAVKLGKVRAFSSGYRFYEGSEKLSRQRGYIWQSAQDQDAELTPTERRDAMAISRLLAANSGLYRGACSLLGRYAVVGRPQSQSADRAWAERAEAAFAEWAKIPEVTGRLTWLDIQRLWNYGIDRDGDIGNILTDGEFPQLQVVEAHRIETPAEAADGDGWIDGVRVNRVGRPVAYSVAGQSIPAPAFMLIGEPNRATGTRHECAWVAGLNHVRDTKEIVGHLKTAIKNESSIAIIRKLHGGTLSNVGVDDWQTATAPSGATVSQVLEKVYGGRYPILDVGEEMQSLATDRPSPNIAAFLEFVIRDFSTGNGLPFEFVWNPTALGGPSQRFVINMAQRRIVERQQLIERHAHRVWGWVVAKLAKRKDIPPLPVDWHKLRWQKPAEITIDVGREQAQDRADFQAGLIGPAEHYGKQGLDVDDVLADRVAWAVKVKAAADKAGVPLWMLYSGTANGNPGDAQQQQQPQEPKP